MSGEPMTHGEGPAPTAETGRSPAPQAFPIVAIGASAGGVEALRRLLGALPSDARLAVVVIQHLSPTHESLLTAALASGTKLRVVEVRDGMRAETGQVHVIPPNTVLALEGDLLRVQPRAESEHPALPIDAFMRSLAHRGEAAVGVVLSGTGSDGTRGLKAIRLAGGRTYAQEPSTAGQDGMPQSAIDADAVDAILTAEEIARDLAALASGAPPPSEASDLAGDAAAALREILQLLKRRTGVDVSQYKPTTLRRRIERRAALVHAADEAAYLHLLRRSPEEVDALHDELFVHVTSFFRDPDVFAALATQVFPALLAARAGDDAPIRVWVSGCATGEEAYSIAIALLDFIGAAERTIPIQVFGSDISERAIRRARAAEYDADVVEHVSRERLERYFERTVKGYRIARFVRDACVFVRHDVTADPPFSRIDLVSCRNVLIYFGATLQKAVLPLFHYALAEDGFLLLGRSEALSSQGELFSPVDRQNRIYARRPGAARVRATPTRAPGALAPGARAPAGAENPQDTQRALDSLLLSRYVPAAVLVNDALDVVQVRGKTSPYLEPASGAASLSLLKMARSGLAAYLTELVQRVRAANAPARRKAVRLEDDGVVRWVDLEVAPFLDGGPLRGRHFLVVFRDRDAPPALRDPAAGELAGASRTAEVRDALEAAQAYASSVAEQYALTNQKLAESNDQLQAANEELQSANEELQSANEELETAKEELQSSNEELTTVNDELQARYHEVNELGNDLQNLVASVDIAIVIVDRDRRVRRFTPRARSALNLLQGDVGRAISEIRPNVDVPDLDAWIAEVIETATVKEVEVRDRDGRWQRLQVRPYQTASRRIEGAVVSLVDIDRLKLALADARRARDFLLATLETVPTPVLVLGDGPRVTSANEAFYRVFRATPGATIGKRLDELGRGPCRDPDLVAKLADALRSGRAFKDLELECELPDGGGRGVFTATARQIPEVEGQHGSIVLAIQDVTALRRSEEQRARAHADEAHRFLNEAGAAMLPSSLEYEATLAALGHVVVPRLADWCIVDLVDADGTIRQAAAAHVDPEKERLARALGRRFRPESDPQHGIARVISTGTPVVFPEVNDVECVADVLGAEHPELLRELGVRSYLSVPLRGRKGVIGALSLARGASGQRYGPGDLAIAEGLGQRAGLAVENARLHLALREGVAARDEFMAMLSHELRNPLAPLRNCLALMERAAPHEPQWRRAQEVAKRQVEHLARLVDDLLDVTRIAHGKIELHRADVDLAALVLRAAEDHRAVIEERGVQLAVETPLEPIFVHGDATRLVQVLGNLLQNAAKFTRANDTVTIALAGNAGWAEIHVRDTGAGIEPATLRELFRPFTQGKQTLARTEGGLGLGLAFVKGLVELHGGAVSVASQGPGRGADFTVRLPLRDPPAGAAREERPGPSAPASRRRVLVVDDNRDAAETLAEFVRMLGHDAVVAFDGPSAIELARRTEPDLVVCDIGLPGMTGYEVARALRRAGLRAKLVALTGYTQPRDKEGAAEAGFDAHLAKPADLADIERVLREGCGEPAGAAASPCRTD